jgi:hypothetical protein
MKRNILKKNIFSLPRYVKEEISATVYNTLYICLKNSIEQDNPPY